MKLTRTLLVGATMATLAVGGVAGAGLASADANSSSGGTSIVDKIASKFNLNKADVQKVFDEDRAQHQAQREADQKQRLADAVKAGKLTQAQADHITSVMNEVKTLMGNTTPDQLSSETRSQIKQKLDDLHDWAKTNNIDMQYVMPGHGGPGGGHMGRGMGMGDPDDNSSSNN